MGWMKRFCIILVLCGYLGVYGDHLALFEDGRLTEVFPYAVQDYSPTDQAALKKGIPFRSNDEKQRILEDYLS